MIKKKNFGIFKFFLFIFHLNKTHYRIDRLNYILS